MKILRGERRENRQEREGGEKERSKEASDQYTTSGQGRREILWPGRTRGTENRRPDYRTKLLQRREWRRRSLPSIVGLKENGRRFIPLRRERRRVFPSIFRPS